MQTLIQAAFALLLNWIIPFVMLLVGYRMKKHPASDMGSRSGYHTPVSRGSRQRWEYAQHIAPDIYLGLGKALAQVETAATALLLLLGLQPDTVVTVGLCIGFAFLLLAFHLTDSRIEERFPEN